MSYASKVEIQPWQTTQFDVKNWVQTLNEFGIDDGAQKQLFLLAQFGDDGAAAANSIIHKILKKFHAGDQVRSWSAFVQSSALNARNSINDRR